MSRTWDQLTLPGKALAILLPLLAVLTLGLVLVLVLFGQTILDILVFNLPIVRFVFAATVLLLLAPPIAFVIIYMEMKIIALMNLRIGPDRVGPWGSLLSTVHGLKVLMKEDFTPTRADPVVFTWAPVVVFSTMALSALVIPFAPGLFAQDFNLGLLYFFAIGGMTVVGLLMGGWSSFNKYSLLGGLRSAAQIVSYEIPLTLSVVGLVILAGTMSLNSIVEQQGTTGWFTDWYVVRQPLGFLIFAIAATAEANRTPFDLTEADSEIVAGFATEYSGMRFGFFFFAEYVNVFILSALMVSLFVGGWNAPIDVHPILDWLNVTFNPAAIDPSQLGLGLLLLIAFAVPLLILGLGLVVWMLKSSWSFLVSLIVGFVLFNVIAVGAVLLWSYASFDVVSGLFWFLAKTFTFAFVFVWMRGTLPRVRIDQLMGWAWKWLVEIALLNIFVTAGAILILDALARR
jgi:NADH-quinone oxidoreductase subunit H